MEGEAAPVAPTYPLTLTLTAPPPVPPSKPHTHLAHTRSHPR